MRNHEIETFQDEYSAFAAVKDYVASGYHATVYKGVDGSYVVESWEE